MNLKSGQSLNIQNQNKNITQVVNGLTSQKKSNLNILGSDNNTVVKNLVTKGTVTFGGDLQQLRGMMSNSQFAILLI